MDDISFKNSTENGNGNASSLERVSWRESILNNRQVVYFRSLIENAALFVVAYFLAFALKYDRFLSSERPFLIFEQTVGWVLLIKLAVFFLGRQYRDVVKLATLSELRSTVVSASVSCVATIAAFAATETLGWTAYRIPVGLFLVDFLLTITLRGGWLLARRLVCESFLPELSPSADVEPVFLIGANDVGARVAEAINSRRNVGRRVVGFLTSSDYKVRMKIGSIPVVARIDDLASAAKREGVKTILFVAGSLSGKAFREIFEKCKENGLKILAVSQIEILSGAKVPIREISVDDLLKREPIRLDVAKIQALVAGRRVLVTGAGGSIGSEICRQLLRFEPKELYLLGRGENRIFSLERELRSFKTATTLVPIIADVANAARIDGVFNEFRPEIVFHAAAHKHVPLMEANVSEAIRNNFYGSKVVADAADRCGAEKFVMISTDKAVNPASVMGCSKQMAERYVSALANRSKTKFIVTRFGNVLGSSGSVVQTFTEQIRGGGPVTITDFRMTRFFMTIAEAAQLVLEAVAMGGGGEIFVLDMGEPVKILTLAKDMIRLAGLPESAIEIQEIGLRPGEKLNETLYFETEKRVETSQKKLFAADRRQFDLDEVQAQLDELLAALNEPPETIRALLKKDIPEYCPSPPFDAAADGGDEKSSRR